MIKRWPARSPDPPGLGRFRYDIAAQEDRCALRTKVSIPAILRRSTAKGFRTVVNDLSIAGFSAKSPSRMHVGSICWLTLPGLESLQSEVIGWQGGVVGCAFARLLSPIIHEHIVSRYPDEDD